MSFIAQKQFVFIQVNKQQIYHFFTMIFIDPNFAFVSLTNVVDWQETFVKYLIFQNLKTNPYSQGNLT